MKIKNVILLNYIIFINISLIKLLCINFKINNHYKKYLKIKFNIGHKIK